MTSTLHVSANQWRTSILKACIGTQVVRGIAEDVADAGLALLALGQDPLPPLLDCLHAYQTSTQGCDWPRHDDSMDLGHLLVLHHGPSAIDMVQAGLQPQFTTDAPILILGLAQARGHSHGLNPQVSIDDSPWLELDECLAQPEPFSASSKMRLRTSGTGDPKPLSTTQLPQPSRQNWRDLQQFADQILVPADATSREDAGVGDGQTDND